VDFHFIGKDEKKYLCEFKMMGKGNPESADVAIVRQTNIFIADTLSTLNKSQLDEIGVHWVELRSEEGFRKIKTIFDTLGIPHQEFSDDLSTTLEQLIPQVFFG
jgi:hypothetical protein